MTTLQRRLLLTIALFGLIVPNGMFFFFVLFRFTSIADVLTDWLALGFIIDAFMAMGLLAWWFARHPLGPHGWRTFILLSLLGGLGFSLPFFYYLNHQNTTNGGHPSAATEGS